MKHTPIIILITLLALLTGAESCAVKKPIDRSVPYGYEGFFSVSGINRNVYLITEMGQATCYLVLGTEKALLIDTGVGVGNLSALVKALTKLPVMVVNTHGHLDHIGGDFLFDEVWIHPLDTTLYNNFYSNDDRINNVKAFVSGNDAKAMGLFISDKDLDRVREIPPAKTRLLEDGDVIDLGGRELEICLVGGHTPGSIMLIDRTDKLLFSGDAVNGWLWMWLRESQPLADFYARFKAIRPRLEGLNYLYGGHEQSVGVTTIAYADAVMAHIESVLAGHETSHLDTAMGAPVAIYEFKDFRLFLDTQQAALYDKK